MSRSAAGALETSIAMASAGASGTAEHEQLKLTFGTLRGLAESTSQNTKSFGEAILIINQLAHQQEKLKHSLSLLSTVGLYFSMEGKKLPANQRESFSSIRSEMVSLQNRVVDMLDEQQRGLEGAREDLDRCMTDTHENQKRLISQIGSRWEQLEKHLEDTLQVPPEVKILQAELAAELAEIRPILATLISTLQGHDAIRQRLMHAMDALEQIAEAEVKHENTEGEFGSFLRETSIVLRGQIEDIQRSLSKLIDDIRGGFEKLAGTVSQLAILAISKDLPGTGSTKSSGEKIIREILYVRELISESLLHNEQLEKSSSLVQSLASTYYRLILEMRDVIIELSFVIKLAALNAQVYAAHSGECGVLGILCQQARCIADESITHSAALSEQFQALSHETQTFRGKLNTANAEHRTQQQNLADCLQTLTTTLEDSGNQAVRTIQELRSTSAGLQEQTAAQLHSLHFLDKGLRLIQEMSLALEECETKADGESGAVMSADLIRILEAMRSRYTMKRECILHDRLSGAGPQDDWLFGTAEESAADEIDNVELF